MLNSERSTNRRRTSNEEEDDGESVMTRDIHALDPPSRSSSSTEFTTISHEFNALVMAGSRIRTENHSGPNNLGRIGEDQNLNGENNPWAIVLDRNPLLSPRSDGGEVTMKQVKKEETEAKINAWENAKIAKINNRFKREEVIIHGREDKQVHKASSWMKEVERKLEERRAKAVEKMQNEIAKAHRKAEERKACAEAKRGTKVARVVEIGHFMRDMGRAPAKRSFFCCGIIES